MTFKQFKHSFFYSLLMPLNTDTGFFLPFISLLCIAYF